MQELEQQSRSALRLKDVPWPLTPLKGSLCSRGFYAVIFLFGDLAALSLCAGGEADNKQVMACLVVKRGVKEKEAEEGK